jgi:hypothetical protein
VNARTPPGGDWSGGVAGWFGGDWIGAGWFGGDWPGADWIGAGWFGPG